LTKPDERRAGPTGSYDVAAVAEILERWRDVPGNLMPILHDVQERLGYVPPDAVDQIARALNQSRAEVHGVISFYHDFRQAPAGRHTLKICQAESCQAVGSRELTAAIEHALGCRLGETTEDGAVTLEPVYCLGLCACSPAALVDHDQLIGRATPERVLAAVQSSAREQA
jgi:formate dehydrogenase subunit gamma